MASENNLPSSEEGERVLDDDDEDSVPEDEDEDEDQEDDVEAKILQLQDQFQEVKQQRKEARLVSAHRPTSPPTHWTFWTEKGGVVIFVVLCSSCVFPVFPPPTHHESGHVRWCG